jgi:Tfp pilus assembly protein PilF
MKKTQQDIYGTDHKRARGTLLSEADQTALISKPLVDAMRRERRTSIILIVLVMTVISLVGVIVIQQHLKTRYSSSHSSASSIRKPLEMSSLDMGTSSQLQFLMDELTDTKPASSQLKGEMPLTVQWVKQVAWHIVQAEKAAREDRLEDALANYGKALVIFPSLQGVQRQLGLLNLKMKNYAEAAAAFEKVLYEEEMTFGLANNLGVAYLAMDDFQKAEQNFQLAVRLNTDYALAHFNLATLYVRSGDAERAVDSFMQYLERKPEDIEAAQTCALLLVQLKRWDRAAGMLKQLSI